MYKSKSFYLKHDNKPEVSGEEQDINLFTCSKTFGVDRSQNETKIFKIIYT